MSKPKKQRLSEGKLGPHHFAHLRSVAEGLDLIDAAKRFLGVEHGHEATAAHRRLVDQVRAIARRTGDSAWRLVGVVVKPKAGAAGAPRPSLERFIEDRGLDDWSESEVVEMYEAAYPAGAADGSARREKLRKRQLDLLKRLESVEAIAPKATDLVEDWFDASTAQRLREAEIFSLAHIQLAMTKGGNWWRGAKGIGVTKARRIEQHLLTLLPGAAADIAAAQRARPVFQVVTVKHAAQEEAPSSTTALPALYEGNSAPVPAPNGKIIIRSDDDKDALRAWVEGRAGSPATARSYEREGRRFLLWLQHERRLQRLSEVTVEDCRAYIVFLQNIPPHWISDRNVTAGSHGWAPFKGPLSHKSVIQSVTITAGWFEYLARTGYLQLNPWLLVNRNFGDAPDPTTLLDSKAIPEEALSEIRSVIEERMTGAARERMIFIVDFMTATGLRSAELLQARMKHLSDQEGPWLLAVHGKGAKNRLAMVPPSAMAALERYLAARGFDLETAPPELPILSKLEDAMEPIGYQALYLSIKRALARAVDAAQIPDKQKAKLRGATTHWLRHTFGTKAVARDVPFDVIQQQLGHASLNTTMSIYARAPLSRRAEALGRAFE